MQQHGFNLRPKPSILNVNTYRLQSEGGVPLISLIFWLMLLPVFILMFFGTDFFWLI